MQHVFIFEMFNIQLFQLFRIIMSHLFCKTVNPFLCDRGKQEGNRNWRYIHYSIVLICHFYCKAGLLSIWKWEVPIKVWDRSQRQKNGVLGVIPESKICSKETDPSEYWDLSQNLIFLTLGSIPDLDWDLSFSHGMCGSLFLSFYENFSKCF